MARKVNCKADFQFQVDARVPGADGKPTDPGAGAIANLKLRLSATRNGAAINGAVDSLACTETALQPRTDARRFKCLVDAALLTTHVLPLGVGASFWAIYSRAEDLDNFAVRYIVADGEG